jgi:hypothetical protein
MNEQPKPYKPPTVVTDPVKQAIADRRLENFLTRYVGKVLTPLDQRKIEKEAREILLKCREEKLLHFRDVEVKISEQGDFLITYDPD